MAGITEFLSAKLRSTGLSPDVWDSLLRSFDQRFLVLEEQLGIERRVTENILARGLQVIEDGIGPAIIAAEQAAANIAQISNLGMLFTAKSTTANLIGEGTKSFNIPIENKDQFSPAAVLIAYADGDWGNAIIGTTKAYNRGSGVLQIDVIETLGSGVFNKWTITPIATTKDLEALRDQVNADRVQSGINAGAAASSAGNAQAIATDFRKKYLGAQATDPTTDLNGNPVTIGAMYTNTVSGKFRYYGALGWLDTTAGSNILVHQFTTDTRGTASYPLPEAPASKDNCFVILAGVPQMRSAFTTSGASISFTSDTGPGRAVEVTIIGQLAIGTPSDETVDQTKIKGSAAAAIRTKLGLDALFAGVGVSLDGKADKTTVAASLATKADAQATAEALETKADIDDVNLSLATKADKDETEAALANRVSEDTGEFRTGTIDDLVVIRNWYEHRQRGRFDVSRLALDVPRVWSLPNRSLIINPSWEQVGDRIEAPYGTLQLDWNSLEVFRRIRLSWDIVPASANLGVALRTSANNGASFASQLGEYRYQGRTLANGSSLDIAVAEAQSAPLVDSGLADNVCSGTVDIDNWNKGGLAYAASVSRIQAPTSFRSTVLDTLLLAPGARNAIRFFAPAGSFQGSFLLEGVR